MDKATTSRDQNLFYLATGLISFISINIVYDKYKRWSKKNKRRQNKVLKQKISPQNNDISPSISTNLRTIQQDTINKEKPRNYPTNFKPQNVFKIGLTGGPCAGKTTGTQ